jgi:hypothetical protein
VKLLHLFGFIIKKIVTMQHGHTNVKLKQYICHNVHLYFNWVAISVLPSVNGQCNIRALDLVQSRDLLGAA